MPTLTLDRLLIGEVQKQYSDSSMCEENVLPCGQGKSVLPMYAGVEREALNGEGRRGTLGDPLTEDQTGPTVSTIDAVG